MKEKNLALFDFDGTITNRDTFTDFLKFTFGKTVFYRNIFILLPVLIGYILKIIPNWKAKTYTLRLFLKGVKTTELANYGKNYATSRLPLCIRPAALQCLQKHQANGDDICIVTASHSAWIKPWADKYQVNFIGTELESTDSRLTGNIQGRNCHGPEKVVRIKAKYNLHNYTRIFAYGDSTGDHEMLSLADEKYYKWEKIS